MGKDLNKIIEDSKKDFHKQTFATILKEWGSGFAKLPNKEKLDTLKEILKLAGISLADSPAGGLAIKIAEGRRRDTDRQERIKYAQSWNLAVHFITGWNIKDDFGSDEIRKAFIEEWQKYFYQKLNNNEGENLNVKQHHVQKAGEKRV